MSYLKDASLNIVNLPRYAKKIIAIIIDVGLCILCTWFAFYLRLEEFIKINDVEYEFSSSEMADWWKEKMIITRGSKGAEYKDITYSVEEVDVRDTSGAGDTFLSGLVYAYINEKNIESAIEFANKCATQVVQKKGTAKINKKVL